MPVREIRIAVDPATLQWWQRALANLCRVFFIPLEFRPPAPIDPPLPVGVVVSGLRFLLDVGRASWRPEALDDPGNLFGLFKYAAAISARDRRLKLSRGMRVLDTHKKKVLSDEFGGGMAFVLASGLFNADRILDFDTAKRRGYVKTKAPKSRRPDFVGDVRNGKIVLEAKGSQRGSVAGVAKQIQRGCEQVSSVRIAGARVPTIRARVVVATALRHEKSAKGTTVVLGDPPEAETDEYAFEPDAEVAILEEHYLRVAALIGDGQLATAMSRRRHGQIGESRGDLAQREAFGQTYVGTRLVMENRGTQLGLFVGLESTIRQRLVAGEAVAMADEPPLRVAEIRPVFEEYDPGHVRQVTEITEEHAQAEDGTLLATWMEYL